MAPAQEVSIADLCEAIGSGKPFAANGKSIPATWIMRLALALPVEGQEAACVTPAGIEIHGATIRGRIELDNASGPGGAPIGAIVLRQCTLEGGFSGAHGHFSRLCLRDCTFHNPPLSAPREGAPPGPLPTVNLIGARIERSLAMPGMRPASAADHLWIRAPNARIAGVLDLSRSHLRAPSGEGRRWICDYPVAALNLAGADIGGDLMFFNGFRCEGRIYARAVHVRGNLWLGGAILEAKEGDPDAIFLQRATIDGSVNMDRRTDRAGSAGPVRDFICAGNLNLRAATIGGDLHIQHAALGGSVNLLDIHVRNDFIFHASVRDSIDLTGCRIGASLYLSYLRIGVRPSAISLKDGIIGRSLRRKAQAPALKLLAARRDYLGCLPDTELVETLWVGRKGDDSELVQAGFLVTPDEIFILDGFSTGFDAAIAKVRYAIDSPEAAIEFMRVYGTYASGEAAFPIIGSRDQLRSLPFAATEPDQPGVDDIPDHMFPIHAWEDPDGYTVEAATLHNGQLCRCRFHLQKGQGLKVVNKGYVADGPALEGLPRFEGHALLHPQLKKVERQRAVARRTWVTGLTVAELRDVSADELPGLARRLQPELAARDAFSGEINLRNLSCDMLDDEGGRHWGKAAHIKMNHFTYRQNTWENKQELHRQRTDARFSGLVAKWVDDWIWPRCLRLPSWLQRRITHWKPWQVRLKWIYQQFEVDRRPPNMSRLDIRDFEYRPQPFEQAIRAARSEGREDFAVQFETRKQLVEWRLFNRRIRWQLALLGVALAAAWLIAHGGSLLWTLLAVATTGVMMIYASTFDNLLRKRIGCPPVRRAAAEILFYLPAFLILLPAEWGDNPFHFITALLIYVGVRSLANMSHVLMRFGFGYLRRPARAIFTLILAFLVGWWGVHLATERDMLVIAAEPVAPLAAPERPRPQPATTWLMGSENVAGGDRFVRDLSCEHELSKPLYALDVLIPIVDLHEESRCEIRRVPVPGHRQRDPNLMSIGELWDAFPALALNHHRFWWWMKAIYAMLGWIFVSLSILTFAQVNKVHAEPQTEHK